MSMISRVVVRALEQDPPFFAPDRCLNRRQTRHPCTLCHERCTGGALPKNPVTEPVDWAKCMGCGNCVTACPARCFAPDIKQQRSMTAPARGGSVSFACAHTREPVGERQVECLSGIPWEWLAALALRMPVQLYTGECGECQVENCREQLLENLALLRMFLGEERFARQVTLQEDAAALSQQKEEEALNRRSILGLFGRSIKTKVASGIGSMLPVPKDDPARDGFAYRRLLAGMLSADCAQQVKKSRETNTEERFEDYGVLLPEFGAKCHGCGVCVRVCPQKALAIEKENERSSVISIEPMKCTACGLCQKVCTYGGITGFEENTVHHLQMQGHVRVYHESCARCGEPIPRGEGEGLCIACSVKYGKGRR